MKKTDLEKNKALKIDSRMHLAGAPARFGSAAAAADDRRVRRKLDQAAGLVPFAVKIDGELVKRIHALAEARGKALNEVVAGLLAQGLDAD